MKRFTFTPEYAHGGYRITVKGKTINLPKIEAFQIVSLDKKLEEPHHINKKGNVVCIVLDGWAEAEVDGQKYDLEKYQGILFEPGEKHRISRGAGMILSITSRDYDKRLGTSWEKS